MAGIDRIISGIFADADAEAAGISAAAGEEAAKLLANAADECRAELDMLKSKADENAVKQRKRIQSAAAAKKRIIILKEKQRIIGQMLQNAYSALRGVSQEEYGQMLKKLLKKTVHPGECVIYFSQDDRQSLGDGFFEDIVSAAAAEGCSMTVSDTARDIDGGFVLAYGGVEENCSFGALFEANYNTLCDRANDILFGAADAGSGM